MGYPRGTLLAPTGPTFSLWRLLVLRLMLCELGVGLSVRYCCYILYVLMLFVVACVVAIHLCCILPTSFVGVWHLRFFRLGYIVYFHPAVRVLCVGGGIIV